MKLSALALSYGLPRRLIEPTQAVRGEQRRDSASAAYWADSSGRRNTLTKEVAMKKRKRRSDRIWAERLAVAWPAAGGAA